MFEEPVSLIRDDNPFTVGPPQLLSLLLWCSSSSAAPRASSLSSPQATHSAPAAAVSSSQPSRSADAVVATSHINWPVVKTPR